MVFENVFINTPKCCLWAILVVTAAIQVIETCSKKVLLYERIPTMESDLWLSDKSGRLAAWSSISRADFQPPSTMHGAWGHPVVPLSLLPGHGADPLPRGVWPLPAQLEWPRQTPSQSARLRARLSATEMVIGENICLWRHRYRQRVYSSPFLFK